MRADFNKLLVERERYGHLNKFHDTRRKKIFDQRDPDGDQFGGREGIRKRHKVSWTEKSFNENLNPLYGWIRTCVGKKWDKCYSELRKTFDARSVINNHILEHLYQSICVKTKIDAETGQILGCKSYSTEWVPIKESYFDYFVCPKDGTVKKLNKLPRRSVIKEQEAKKKREQDSIFRVLDKENHLHLIDGVWYVFGIKELPDPVIHYNKPPGVFEFKVGSYNHYRLKTWEELNESEKKKHGVKTVLYGECFDVFLGKTIHKTPNMAGYQGTRRYPGVYTYGLPTSGKFTYYATKATASHKMLKQAGITT